MGKVIYDSRDIRFASEDMLRNIDKGLIAAAYRLADKMKVEFINGGSLYKKRTSKYDALKEGFLVGKLRNNEVKIHALGNNIDHSYKTRFFVGGTKKNGVERIKANDALNKGLVGGMDVLTTYIKNSIK